MTPGSPVLGGAGADEDEPVFCRTCKQALNPHWRYGRLVAYLHRAELHGGRVDHRADPVPLSQLPDARPECDFCADPPSWIYIAGDQLTEIKEVTATVVSLADHRQRHHAARARRVETAPGLGHLWGERWAACDDCATLIEAGDLYGLIRRVTEKLPPKIVRGNRLVKVRAELHANYGHLLATRRTGRARITTEHPLGVWEDPPEQP